MAAQARRALCTLCLSSPGQRMKGAAAGDRALFELISGLRSTLSSALDTDTVEQCRPSRVLDIDVGLRASMCTTSAAAKDR